MNTFCNKMLIAGQLLLAVKKEKRKNVMLSVIFFCFDSKIENIKFNCSIWNMQSDQILTVFIEIGDHSPNCSYDGSKSKNKTNKNPNASSTSFHATTTELHITVNLKQSITFIDMSIRFDASSIYLSLGDWINHD